MAADEDTKGTGETVGFGDGKPGDKAGERRQKDRRRTPVTIDLKAEEVRSAATAAASPTAKPEPAVKAEASPKVETPTEPLRAGRPERPPTERSRAGGLSAAAARSFANMDDVTKRTAVAGVLGGLAALIVVIVLQAIGLLPAPGRSAANAAAEQARSAAEATAAMERRVTAIEAMVESLPAIRTDVANLDERMAALRDDSAAYAAKSDVEGVVTVLGQLRQRIDAIPPSASRDDLDGLAERIGRLEMTAAAGGGDSAGSEAAITSLASQLGNAETALRSLTERLAAAEFQMASLGTPNPMAGGEAAVRAIAITALRRASEGSAPFRGELDMVAALGVSGDEIAGLRPYADRGVPARAALVTEFPAVADEILKASATSDPDAGFFSQIVVGLGGLISVRPAGPIAGGDPQAIVSRMTAAIKEGDLQTALSEREALPAAGQTASAAWAASATDRVSLDELVEGIARNLGDNTG